MDVRERIEMGELVCVTADHLRALERANRSLSLSDWEQDFVNTLTSMVDSFKSSARFSAKQSKSLLEIGRRLEVEEMLSHLDPEHPLNFAATSRNNPIVFAEIKATNRPTNWLSMIRGMVRQQNTSPVAKRRTKVRMAIEEGENEVKVFLNKSMKLVFSSNGCELLAIHQ